MSLEIEYRALDALEENPRNCRQHEPDQVVLIADSIRRFGFTNPVLIDEAGVLIAGHGRLMAARLAGLTEVPCVVLKGLSDEEKRAYVIADNRLAEKSRWDEGLLMEELEALQDAGFDELLLGFSAEDIDELAGEFASPEDEGVLDAGSPRIRDEECVAVGAEDMASRKAAPLTVPLLFELSHAEFLRWKALKYRLGISDNAKAFRHIAELDGEARE